MEIAKHGLGSITFFRFEDGQYIKDLMFEDLTPSSETGINNMEKTDDIMEAYDFSSHGSKKSYASDIFKGEFITIDFVPRETK